MNLDAGGVQRHRFDLDAHDLLALQCLKHLVEHTGLGPAAHACVDGVPIAKALWQSAPLAAVLGHIQHGVDDLQIAQTDVAALQRKAVLNARKLLFCDFHDRQFRRSEFTFQLVLTRPSACDPLLTTAEVT